MQGSLESSLEGALEGSLEDSLEGSLEVSLDDIRLFWPFGALSFLGPFSLHLQLK